MKKLNLLIMIFIISIISAIIIISCATPSEDDSDSKTKPDSSSVSSSTESSTASSTMSSTVSSTLSSTSQGAGFIETFNNVPDNTDIRDNVNLDNPASFTSSNFSAEIRAGYLVSGSGAIAMCNISTNTNSNRMAFTFLGLSSMSAPVLKLTIKNDNGSGVAVSNLMINIGNSFTTNGSVGVSGQRAYGEHPVTNTAYQVLTFTLSTSFTSTNIIQIRPVISNSSTGAGGIYIDRIEITDNGSTSSSSSTSSASSAASSTSSSVSSTVSSSASSASYSLPSSGSPIGFATANTGTNGGALGDVKYASTGTELQNFINLYKSTNLTGRTTRTSPRIIYITGAITVANSPDDIIYLKGSNDDEPFENISLIGVGTSGEFNGIGLKIERSHNIIIQNIKFHHVLYNTGDGDGLGVVGPATNIWIDHCEFYNSLGDLDGDGTVGDDDDKDFYDGLLDTKDTGVQYITYSHNIFHDSYKTCLMGSSASDAHEWYVTFYANHFYNCNSRLPLIRGGTVHVLNNYYFNNTGSGINNRCGGTNLIEGNYFEDSTDVIGHFYGDTAGYWDLGPGAADSNYYDNITWSPIAGEIYITAQSSGFLDTGTFTPGYGYTAMAAAAVPAYVLANAGTGKL